MTTIETEPLERLGIPHYLLVNDVNPLLNDEKCESVRRAFEGCLREGYGRTLHSQMNLFDVPNFLSMMSVRSCVRTHPTCHELDQRVIDRYRAHKTILFCTMTGYAEPWCGKIEKISTLAMEGAASMKGVTRADALKHRLKRQRMQALEKPRPNGERGRLLPLTSCESYLLGKVNVDVDEKKRIITNMEYWRNLLLFKKLFRDSCEEVEIYDKQPVHIGVCICDDPVSACDMACRLLDKLTVLKRKHFPGGVRTSEGPLIGDVSFGIASGNVYDLDNEDLVGAPLERARELSESLPVGHIVIDESCLRESARELNGKFHTRKVDHDEKGSWRLMRHSN